MIFIHDLWLNASSLPHLLISSCLDLFFFTIKRLLIPWDTMRGCIGRSIWFGAEIYMWISRNVGEHVAMMCSRFTLPLPVILHCLQVIRKANSVVCTADPGPDGINVWFDFTSTERLAQLTLWGFSLSSKALTAAQDIFQPVYQVVFRCFACVTL